MLHCGEPLAHSDQDKESGGGSLSYLNNLPSSFCLFGSGIIGGSAVGIRKKMYRVTGHEVGIGILPKVSPLFLAVTHSNNEASFKQTYCVLCWLTASNVSFLRLGSTFSTNSSLGWVLHCPPGDIYTALLVPDTFFVGQHWTDNIEHKDNIKHLPNTTTVNHASLNCSRGFNCLRCLFLEVSARRSSHSSLLLLALYFLSTVQFTIPPQLPHCSYTSESSHSFFLSFHHFTLSQSYLKFRVPNWPQP